LPCANEDQASSMLAQSKPSLVLNTPTHTVSSSQDAIEEITEVHLVLRHFEQTICLLKAKSDRLQSREDRPNRPKGQHVGLIILAFPCTVSLD
jgi:hypothetical protein